MSDWRDKRIKVLESELERAAAALQKVHPIGQVKAIGLLEVGLAAEQVAGMWLEAFGPHPPIDEGLIEEAVASVYGKPATHGEGPSGGDPTGMYARPAGGREG